MYSIAKFGSGTRQEKDIYSDSDLLVVCPASHRKKLYKQYASQGFSVTLLSLSQLEYMQKKNSLFLQHLKRDAKIIVDDNSKLRSFLDSCGFTPPEDSEIKRCENTIQYIASLPNTLSTSAWKADFLYCISRDYLVKKLAKENILAFGFKDICRHSVETFSISENELIELSKLRKAKAAYRSSFDCDFDISSTNYKWLFSLGNTFCINIEMNCHLDFDLLMRRSFNSTYEKLRTLELLYLLARSSGYSHPDHKLVTNFICNPNLYGSSRKCSDAMISRYMLDIHSGIANKAMHWTASPLRFASLQSFQ
jgi:hypothetical protein